MMKTREDIVSTEEENTLLEKELKKEIQKIENIRFNFCIEKCFNILGEIWNFGIRVLGIIRFLIFTLVLFLVGTVPYFFLQILGITGIEKIIFSNRIVSFVFIVILFWGLKFWFTEGLQKLQPKLFSLYNKINNSLGDLNTFLKNQVKHISTGQFIDALIGIYELSLSSHTNKTIEEILIKAQKNRAYLRTLERIGYFSFLLSEKSKEDIGQMLYLTAKIHIQIIQKLLTQLSFQLAKYTKQIHQAKAELHASYMHALEVTPLQIARLERQLKQFQQLQTKIENSYDSQIELGK